MNRAFQALTVCLCFLVAGCTGSVDPNKAIVGTWLSETEVGGEWTFRSDGTATEHLTKTGEKAEYTYKIIDDNKIDLIAERTKTLCLYRFDGANRLDIMWGGSQIRPKEITEKKGFDRLSKLKRKS